LDTELVAESPEFATDGDPTPAVTLTDAPVELAARGPIRLLHTCGRCRQETGPAHFGQIGGARTFDSTARPVDGR